MSGNHKNPVEQAVDLLFFAPIGLAVTARDLLPQLIERGRARVTGQVTTARLVGEFAVQQGQREVGKVVGRARGQVSDRAGGARATSSSAPVSTNHRAEVHGRDDWVLPSSGGPSGPGATPAESAMLAIPDYDSLSASQVVPRLVGLARDELGAVQDYEERHRARKTILNRIAQLQGE